eukprot:CAMPEP_0201945236 /NCGR_PEP_ID=MMETSP0903-20130614/53800_1 /ASSEMBLY_ACC=CAM_ASM_000552 /TAXON_ID=420261 /ORGANISM="Thalassiosira antarctica, Strain CCMP982" /LENGTH=1088 /DNA_ID=CAMNT_0048488299 /DNA_START=16 /DNA_END=3282 /DNA_ORIENTATION=-
MVASVAGYEDMEDGASVAGYDVMKADQIRRTCWAWQKSESKKRGRNRTMTLGELKDGTNGLIALALAEKSKGKTKTCWMLLIPGLENVDPKRSRDVLNKKTKNDWQEKLRKEDGEKFPEDMSIRSFRGDTSTTSAREDMSTNSGTSSVRSSRRAESSTRHRDDDNPKPSSRSKSTARKPSPVSSHPSSSRHHHSSSRTIRGDMHESSFRDDDDSTRHGSSNSPDSKSYQKKKSSKTFNYNDDHSAVNSARTRTSSRDKSSQRSRATSSNKKPHQDSHKKRSGGHSSSHRSDHSTVTSVNTNTSRKYHSNHGNNDWGSAFTVLEEHDEDFSELSIPKTDAKPTKQESPLRTKEQILKMAIPNPSLNKLASADIKFFRDLVQEVSSAKVHGANKSLCDYRRHGGKSTARKPSPVSSHPSSSRHHHSSSRTIRGDMHESSFRDDDDSTRHGSSNSPDSKSYQKKKSSKTFNYNDDHSAVNSARTRTSSRDKSSQRSRATSSNKKPHQDSHKKRSGGHSSSHRSDHSTVTSVNTNTSRKYHSNHGNNDWGSAFTVLEEHDEDFSELSIPKTDAKPTKQESPLRTKEQILKMAIPNPSLNKLASADIKFFRDLVQEVSSAKVHGANKSLCDYRRHGGKSTARKPSPVSSHPSSSRHHHSSSRTIRGDMHESSFRDDDDSTRHGSSNSPDSKSYQKKKSSKTFNYNDDHSAVNSARTRTSSRDKSSQRSRATSSNKKPHQDSHKKRSGGHSSSHRSDHSTVTSVNTNTSRKYHSNHGNNDWGSAFTVLEEHDEDFSELSIPKTDAKPTKQESPLRTKEQILKMAIPNPSLNKLASADIKFFRDLVQEVSSAKVHGANKSLCREYVTTCCVYNDETAGTARKAIIQKEEEADKHNEGIQISKDKVEEKKQEVDEKKARIEQAKATAQTKHSELDENLTRKISEIHAKKEEEQRRVNDEYATKEAAAIGKCASRKQVIDTNLKEKTSSIGAEVKQGEKDHVKLEKEVSTDIKRKAETVDAAQKHINVVDSGAASILSFQKEWAPEGEEQGKMNANTKQSLLNGMYAHQALMVAHNRKEEGVEAEKGVDPNVQAKEA